MLLKCVICMGLVLIVNLNKALNHSKMHKLETLHIKKPKYTCLHLCIGIDTLHISQPQRTFSLSNLRFDRCEIMKLIDLTKTICGKIQVHLNMPLQEKIHIFP